jgi:anti-sigma regulatory factor (Ser/Thr protein kinase)
MRNPPLPMLTIGQMVFTRCPAGPSWLRMAPSTEFVPKARQFTRAVLSDCDAGYVDDVEVVASELVTNAIRYAQEHGDPPRCVVPGIWLGVQALKRHVHLYVRDPYPVRPVKRTAADTDTSGRGLFIVEALSAALWVDRRTHDKTVHAVIAKPDAVLTEAELDRIRGGRTWTPVQPGGRAG